MLDILLAMLLSARLALLVVLYYSPSPVYLTPSVPLSFKGEGEGYGREASSL